MSWYQKGKTNLDLLEQEIVSGSSITLAISKYAPRPRQITMPTPPLSFLEAKIKTKLIVLYRRYNTWEIGRPRPGEIFCR